ncbi:response regulator [Salinisphaera sp. USBA-960]|uniref:response regulator n=1 Tax=Salinisphaera orenii TaxID=856731 RepID=UPI000DBE19FD|nr:response regulator [Salifodinibacter halophilus]NNC27026.1 response regulator [Salifodinibacter halophilus]
MTTHNAADTRPGDRVLVIDDEVHIRRFLRIGLTSRDYQFIEAASAEDGLAQAATASPDLIVLDLGLPARDGHEVLAELRGWSSVPVIVLSVRDHETEKVKALDGGANDYVTKPFGMNEMLARIRNQLRSAGRHQEDEGRYDDGYLAFDIPARRLTVGHAETRLTRKEFAVLRMLVQNRGRVVTQAHLLRENWGGTHSEDTHYLRIIIQRLRQKLGDDPTEPRYVFTEPGVGYRFDPQIDAD